MLGRGGNTGGLGSADGMMAQSKLQEAIGTLGEKHAKRAKEAARAKPPGPQRGPVYIRGAEDRRREAEEAEKQNDSDSDSEFLDDPELDNLRAARLEQLKAEYRERAQNLSKGHGQYKEIVEEEFLKEVTGSKFVACHFYHRDFERCKIIDMHLGRIAQKYLKVKFIKLDSEKSPFFSAKLAIRVLPTIVFFIDGKAVDRMVGFDEMAGSDEFPTALLEQRIQVAGLIDELNTDDHPEWLTE
eukprot:gnl/Hemi2/25624_TR8613_c0_g1_i1.p1 gnl/Hemi2/25624_TR8613_c0_g1~~gnl/Hemi2/25624_TR8613_c0_g1_i1.p1  ORF type:complete len:242 (-),score=87.24 gnl/Hemi2/25624_TR8613_c0_g1_i1:76-801(-)